MIVSALASRFVFVPWSLPFLVDSCSPARSGYTTLVVIFRRPPAAVHSAAVNNIVDRHAAVGFDAAVLR